MRKRIIFGHIKHQDTRPLKRSCLLLFILIFPMAEVLAQSHIDTPKLRARRNEMVQDQIAFRGVNDPRIPDAMTTVLRHAFVPKRLHRSAYFGRPEAAPFDAIMITAAVDHIPPPLIKQLKDC